MESPSRFAPCLGVFKLVPGSVGGDARLFWRHCEEDYEVTKKTKRVCPLCGAVLELLPEGNCFCSVSRTFLAGSALPGILPPTGFFPPSSFSMCCCLLRSRRRCTTNAASAVALVRGRVATAAVSKSSVRAFLFVCFSRYSRYCQRAHERTNEQTDARGGCNGWLSWLVRDPLRATCEREGDVDGGNVWRHCRYMPC